MSGAISAPSLQFSTLVFHPFNLEHTFLIAADLELTNQRENSQQRCLPTSCSIIKATDCTSVGFRHVWINIDLWLACTGEVAIHNTAPDFGAAAAYVLSEAIVGQEIAEARVGD